MSSAVVGLGCLACLFVLLGCSRRWSVGAPGAGTAAVVVAGCPVVVVLGPPSQQMSCQRLRMERRACMPPVWLQMTRNRRQRRDQRKQQSGGSSRSVVGSARGGRDTTTEYCRSAAAAATGAAGEPEAGCGRAATVAGGGDRWTLAAAFGGHTARRGAGGWRQDWYQRTADTAAYTAGRSASSTRGSAGLQHGTTEDASTGTTAGPAASRGDWS